MALSYLTEIEYNQIKTICEFLFLDQYGNTASFSRFEKCFQPLFCEKENISFLKIFKDIVGPKKKYITYKRFLKSYINYKNKSDILSNDTKIFFSDLFNSILKREDDSVGENLENNMLYSTSRNSKNRDSITKLEVLKDDQDIIHGFNLEYDEIHNVKMIPKSLEDELQVILEMKLNIIDTNLFKRNKKLYKNNINDLYRDAITHIFGTMNDEGYITFMGFKCITNNIFFVGFPEGKGFLFGEFGKKIHDFKVQLNQDGITQIQLGFKKNQKTNYYLSKIKNFSLEELNKEEIIKDEEILTEINDEEELDKLITTDLFEDDDCNRDYLNDKFNGNDYKEVVNIYSRKWPNDEIFDENSDKNLLINSVEDAIEKYDLEDSQSLSRTHINLDEDNGNVYNYNHYFLLNPNPFLKYTCTNEFIPNPFFHKKQQNDININNNNLKIGFHKSDDNSKNFKNPLYLNDEDSGNKKKLNKTQIIPNSIRIGNKYSIISKENYNNIMEELAKDIHKYYEQKFKGDNYSDQRIFLNKLFPYQNVNNNEITSDEKIESKDEIELEDNKSINQEELQKEDSICSNALIFEKQFENLGGKLRGRLFDNFFKKVFSKKNLIISNWHKLRNGLENKSGVNLFKKIICIIIFLMIKNKLLKAKKSVKLKLYSIFKENKKKFNFWISKIKREKIKQNFLPKPIIPHENEKIASPNILQKNLGTLKNLKEEKNLSKIDGKKIDILYKQNFNQINIVKENIIKKQKHELIRKNNIDVEKYMKEEEDKRKKLIEEENKKIEEMELKTKLEEGKEKQKAKTLLKESFYYQDFSVEDIFLKQKKPEKLVEWKDDLFIPGKKSLCPFNKKGKWIIPKEAYDSDVARWEYINWCHSEEINERANYQIILNEPNYENVIQGDYLQDCYFISAVCSLCSRKNYINELFHIKTRTKENAYGVYLYLNGKKKLVLIDDYVPCININSTKNLCFGFSFCNNEMWVSLLEKAWAKINGSYIKIGSGGYPNEVFDVLTEAYTEHIIIPHNYTKKTKDSLWKKLDEGIRHNYMICLGTSKNEIIEQYGLTASHAYTLLKIYELKINKRIEKVVKLRNPYGNYEFNGRWSDNSKVWTEDLKKICDFKNADDGIFHMSYEDMLKCFYVIDIAKLETNYKREIVKIKKSENTHFQVIKFEIEKNKTNCYINLYQKNPRIIKKNGKYPNKPVLGYIILAKMEKGKLIYINSETSISEDNDDYNVNDDNNIKINFSYRTHFAINETLKPGIYYIFCDVNYRYIYEENSGYAITLYSEHPIKNLNNLTHNINGNQLLKEVVLDYCTRIIKAKTVTKQVEIYQTINRIHFPFVAICIKNKTKSNISVEFLIKNDEDEINSCFYAEENEENIKEEEDYLIKCNKYIQPNSFEICITMPFSYTSRYELKRNINIFN